MADTDFGELLVHKKKAWSRDLWRQARNNSFVLKNAGTAATSCIQKITALTKSEKGDRAITTLVPELVGNGIAGDNTLEGNEEQGTAYDFEIPIDQHRMGMKSKGRMTEQATIVQFRKTARDLIGYRFGTVIDRLGFNTLSGLAPDTLPNGTEQQLTTVTGGNLKDLGFTSTTPPTDQRAFFADAVDDTVNLGEGVGTAIPGRLTYGHIVNLKAEAVSRYIKPVMHSEYGEVYYMWVSPKVMANLKLDPDFLQNIRLAMPRSKKNDLFVGTDAVLVDGVVVMSHRYVVTNIGSADNTVVSAATTGGAGIALPKFGILSGTNNATVGARCLFLGAQALCLADLGAPTWEESDSTDYKNKPGMATGKLYGMAKSQYKGSYDDAANLQDFGALTLDVAQV